MTPEQCRMARAGLSLTVADLAAKAGVRPATISNFERGNDALASTINSLRQALTGLGVRFEGQNGVFVDENT